MPDERDGRHLWVRLGGPTFCGKRGCGVLMTDAAIASPCRGEESAGIKLLREIQQHPDEQPRAI